MLRLLRVSEQPVPSKEISAMRIRRARAQLPVPCRTSGCTEIPSQIASLSLAAARACVRAFPAAGTKAAPASPTTDRNASLQGPRHAGPSDTLARVNGARPRREDSGSPDHPPAELDKSGAAIQSMFAGVARRYDLLNHLLSGNLDRWWRRQAAAALALPAGASALDLCCGTGDQALALFRRGARVAAADFCVPMLALARPKFGRRRGAPAALAADALTLPFPAARFAGATVSFGLRNVANLEAALLEIARTLEP